MITVTFSLLAQDVGTCIPLTPFFARTFHGLFISWIPDFSTLNTLRWLFMEMVFVQNGLWQFKKSVTVFSVHASCSRKQQSLRLRNRNFRISFKEWTKRSVTRHVLLVRKSATDTQLSHKLTCYLSQVCMLGAKLAVTNRWICFTYRFLFAGQERLEDQDQAFLTFAVANRRQKLLSEIP